VLKYSSNKMQRKFKICSRTTDYNPLENQFEITHLLSNLPIYESMKITELVIINPLKDSVLEFDISGASNSILCEAFKGKSTVSNIYNDHITPIKTGEEFFIRVTSKDRPVSPKLIWEMSLEIY
jgi:hypothetical protein